jgi:DNA/RNA endonuclease YhcR with UshA esterase domain
MKKILFASIIFFVLSGILPALTVYDIQYAPSDGISPYLGDTVEVEGIVTASGYLGRRFYISDPEGGPWRGIYVYHNTDTVAEGERLRITAIVEEYYELTELKNVSSIVRLGTSRVPAPYTTDCLSASTFESLEGVLIRIESPVISRIDSTSKWYVSDGTGELKVRRGFNYTFTPTLSESLSFIQGVIQYSFGEYHLEPRSNDDIGTISAPAETVTVHDIQYSEDGASPYNGRIVTVSGIVTGSSYRGSKFFIADPGTNAPYTGLYIFDNTRTTRIGDYVTVTGEITEYYDLTELKNVSSFSVDSSGGTVMPAIVTIPEAMSEPYEAMLVTINDLGVGEVTESFWTITDGTNTMQVLNGFRHGYVPVEGERFFGITGLVYYTYDMFKLEPRMVSDILSEGIAEKSIPSDLSFYAYPNPFNSTIYIDAPYDAVITISDLSGRIVLSDLPSKGAFVAPSSLKSGIYNMKMTLPDGRVEVKRIALIR